MRVYFKKGVVLMKGDKLTPKQIAFVEEYLIDMNATRAYKAAYPSIKNDAVAGVNGNRLLKNARIEAYLHKRMDERSKVTQITAESTLRGINNIAEANITDVVTLVRDDNGTLKMQVADFDKLPRNIKAAIQSIKQNKDGSIEIKMHDKLKALELQAKHQGLFEREIEVVTNVKIANPFEGMSKDDLIKLAKMQ